jgi:hypothetical protein
MEALACWSYAGWSVAEGEGSLGGRNLGCSPPLLDMGQQRWSKRRMHAMVYGSWCAEWWSAQGGLGGLGPRQLPLPTPPPLLACEASRWPRLAGRRVG